MACWSVLSFVSSLILTFRDRVGSDSPPIDWRGGDLWPREPRCGAASCVGDRGGETSSRLLSALGFTVFGRCSWSERNVIACCNACTRSISAGGGRPEPARQAQRSALADFK
eukprot:4954462-Prymnesium_polylepis.1